MDKGEKKGIFDYLWFRLLLVVLVIAAFIGVQMWKGTRGSDALANTDWYGESDRIFYDMHFGESDFEMTCMDEVYVEGHYKLTKSGKLTLTFDGKPKDADIAALGSEYTTKCEVTKDTAIFDLTIGKDVFHMESWQSIEERAQQRQEETKDSIENELDAITEFVAERKDDIIVTAMSFEIYVETHRVITGSVHLTNLQTNKNAVIEMGTSGIRGGIWMAGNSDEQKTGIAYETVENILNHLMDMEPVKTAGSTVYIDEIIAKDAFVQTPEQRYFVCNKKGFQAVESVPEFDYAIVVRVDSTDTYEEGVDNGDKYIIFC